MASSRAEVQPQECVKQCGFHVVDTPVVEGDGASMRVVQSEKENVQLSCMTASLLATESNVQEASRRSEDGSQRMSVLYTVSKTRLAPASMSPGLALSQGDMTLAEYSHLTPGVKKMMRSVVRGLKAYQEPEAASEGLGGTYFFKSEAGVKIAIMKPCDEEPLAPSNPKGFVGRELGEPGLKPTVRVGEAASREVAAYLLDHERYAGVPHTVMVRMSHPIFHYGSNKRTMDAECAKDVEEDVHEEEELPLKLGSLQSFVHHECDTTEMGTSLFDKKDVHRIGILDIRLFNTDRHGGNILVKKVQKSTSLSAIPSKEQYQLIPIDHGFALPEGLEPPYFEWQHWPQAMLPFDKEELEYIANLDAKADVDLLRRELPDIHEASFRVLELSTMLLQQCAAAGLSLSEIAGVITRPIIGIDEEPSELEKICFEIRREMFEEMKAAREAVLLQPISHFSSMSVSEAAEETAVSTPDSGSSATHFQMTFDELHSSLDDNSAGRTVATKLSAEDALFCMDEDGGDSKTPLPSSPLMSRRNNAYNEAPSLRVKATGELETPTPFGTTFKSVLGGQGSSPSYESDSPTHPVEENAQQDLHEEESGLLYTFRGAHSYAPAMPKFATVQTLKLKSQGFPRASSRAQLNASMTALDHNKPLSEPRGCSESSYVLKEMDEREWQIFLTKASARIAIEIQNGSWVDSFNNAQVVQMSCPRF